MRNCRLIRVVAPCRRRCAAFPRCRALGSPIISGSKSNGKLRRRTDRCALQRKRVCIHTDWVLCRKYGSNDDNVDDDVTDDSGMMLPSWDDGLLRCANGNEFYTLRYMLYCKRKVNEFTLRSSSSSIIITKLSTKYVQQARTHPSFIRQRCTYIYYIAIAHLQTNSSYVILTCLFTCFIYSYFNISIVKIFDWK